MKDDRVYLLHILDCIAATQAHTQRGREDFFGNRLVHKATLRELQEIAESTQRISKDLTSRHPEIPWSSIAGFRNVVVHGYLDVDLARVWEIVTRDLPPLREAVEAMLKALPETPE